MLYKKKLFSYALLTIFTFNFITRCESKPVKVIAISYQKIIAQRSWDLTFKKIAQALTQIPLRDVPEALIVIGTTLKLHFQGHEILIPQLIGQYPFLARYKEIIYEIATAAVHNGEMIALLKRLKNNGVILVCATNTWVDWIDYLKQTKAEVFDLFDLFCIGSQEHGLKPEIRYFSTMNSMIEKYISDQNFEIIFLDSNKENVEVVNQASLNGTINNIKGLRFVSVELFEKELIKLGYL